MAALTEISWCDSTFNGWIGCTRVSPGCLYCYAALSTPARVLRAAGHETWGEGAPRSKTKTWGDPVKWNKQAQAAFDAYEHWQEAGAGHPWLHEIPRRPRVFCSSLSDWLDDEVPIEWLAEMLALIHATPNLDWLLLTKRPENFQPRLEAVLDSILERNGGEPTSEADFIDGWINKQDTIPANVWIGTTVEDQVRADQRIPAIMQIPAKVRFLSCEPLLGPLDVSYPDSFFPNGPGYCCTGRDCGCMGRPIDPPMIYGIDWVICGGESGPGARPFDIAWARSLRDQCQSVGGVAFFMKQLGSNPVDADSAVPKTDKKGGDFESLPADLRIREFPTLP